MILLRPILSQLNKSTTCTFEEEKGYEGNFSVEERLPNNEITLPFGG